MVTSPCKDCPDRYVGCHSKCDKYLEFKEQHSKEKTIIQLRKKEAQDEVARAIETYNRVTKSRRR